MLNVKIHGIRNGFAIQPETFLALLRLNSEPGWELNSLSTLIQKLNLFLFGICLCLTFAGKKSSHPLPANF
jgi:hypothetical protein